MNVRYCIFPIAALFFCSLSEPASAETIYLKDGAAVQGRIVNVDETSITIEVNNALEKIDRNSVETIKQDTPPAAIAPRTPTEWVKPEPPKQEKGAFSSKKVSDLRIKYGGTAGITEGDIGGITVPMSEIDDKGVGFQADLVLGLYGNSAVGFVVSAGIFSRRHSGNDNDPGQSTQIYYDAAGLSLGAGIGIKAGEHLHFEGKIEVGLGAGEPVFRTPGVVWNDTEPGRYSSVSLIAGAYVTISTPGIQLGIEAGTQSFSGDFAIMNNFGQSIDGNVNGSGGIINVVLGYRF